MISPFLKTTPPLLTTPPFLSGNSEPPFFFKFQKFTLLPPTMLQLFQVNNFGFLRFDAFDFPLKLKVVSATFVLVCFLSLNESTFQTRKNVFYFTSKALFVLKKIKFQNSTFSSFMTSSFYWQMKFLKQAIYIRYVIANLSKYVQISMLTSTESFSQRIL